jgi:predicted Zn-dependent protease
MATPRSVLVLAVVGIVPAFAAVGGLVSSARGRRQQLASAWADRGAKDFAAGRPIAAAEDYRLAQEYARDRSQYRLPLARALLGAGRVLEAHAQLLTLWSEAPGNGIVNLELGRLAAGNGDVPAAIRYYHGAIDGAYDADAPHQRRRARVELARVLLDHGERTQAQAELIALSADPPKDPVIIEQLASLRIRAGLDPVPARRLPIDLRTRIR